ncbi:prefoldin subunit family protein [Arabis alpina]|uniref:Prefoldin subunit family protein n=1 Tax=Arabis alpina TaxID=50452 RepID=A0A087HKR8_ARAAL|nr:prefoldin subunit family protein [Arabis alpina]
MDPPAKGTVTPIASLFSPEEAQKAASYVEVKIEEKRSELNRLQQFVDENSNLINLIKKLPDKLHHNVPFGKMAFFPGRLIHTNECMVLLGENYYVDRTSKQAIEVLKRRDKTLQSQIHSLKAEIDDFQAEASFFTSTASEAADGLVEIREEYEEEEEEEEDSGTVVQSGVKEASGVVEEELEDDEFVRIMSRLNELEMAEEREGEDGDDKGGEEHDSPTESEEESEKDMVKGIRDETEEQETIKSVLKKASTNSSSIREPIYTEPRVKAKVIEVLPEKHLHTGLDDPSKCIGRRPQNPPKEDQSRVRIPGKKTVRWSDQVTTSGSIVKAKADVVGPQKIESPMEKEEPEFDSTKAFTGSIVEHAHNPETNTHGLMQQSSGSQPSKPVSRFKAQRR